MTAWVDEWMDGRTDRYMDEEIDIGQMYGWMDERTNGQMGKIYERMDVWING